MTRSVCGPHFSKLILGLVVAVAGILIAAALPTPAHAATIYVSALGSDTAGDGSVGSPYATVQRAIDSTSSVADVQVGPGNFTGDITMKDGVSLHGAGALKTTLTGSGTLSVITASDIGTNTSISGFTITGGGGPTTSYGGGIYCDASSLGITNDIITGNTAHYAGAGIYCTDLSSPNITNDIIDTNTAGYNGGGVDCEDSSPNISNDTIAGNSATLGDGAGIYCYASYATITNDVITGNVAGRWGGAVGMGNSAPTIVNDTVAGNTAGTSGGAIWAYLSPGTISNCIIWGNGDDLYACSATYCDISNASEAADLGDISAAPSFVDSATGNFHLIPASPGIDEATATGAPATDKDGVARPQGHGFDMGAYEYIPHTHTLTPVAGLGGSITPSSTQVVFEGDSKTFSIVADTGHHIADVKIGNVSIGASSSVTFADVTADATLTAAFAINPVISTTTRLRGASSSKVKTTYKLSGTVSPAPLSGTVTITMTRLVGRKYKNAGTAKVTLARGTFSYSFKPKYKGSWHFVASYPGGVVGPTNYKGSKSGTKTVKVT